MDTLKFLALLLTIAFASFGCRTPSANTAVNTSLPAGNEQTDVRPEGGGGEVKGDLPEKLVAELYKQHDAKKSPFFQKDRARIDKYFTKQLGDLVFRDATNPVDGTGAIGADPLYDAQDIEIKNFAVGTGAIDGSKATVNVTFTNFGEKKTIVFSLVGASDEWRISDIKYSHGSTLLAMLREAYGDGKTNAPPIKNVAGEFEGTYQVGETTCTVKPVKMAFEVRWAKGSGVEMFHFDEGNTFESDTDTTAGRSKFIFDDENYNAGTFKRADGKVFTVRRKN
jgi:hypothetical protein